MSTIYWDCSAGISGNMAVASLLDLGIETEYFQQELDKIPFPEGPIKFIFEQKIKMGIRCLYFNTLEDQAANSKKCFSTALKKKHSHDQMRGFQEIRALIEESRLAKSVKEMAIHCFRVLGKAEAQVHGTTLEKIHFHEVGARDSIADIVGTAVCLDKLGVSSIFTSSINVGSGFTLCSHGKMPIPAPATAFLLRNFPIFSEPGVSGELTTPTGAAILCGYEAKVGLPKDYCYSKVGHGAGFFDLPIPNVLRAFLGNTPSGNKKLDSVVILETNIDNASGELLGYAFDAIMKKGALDVSYFPIFMKKGRPGVLLSVLVSPQHAEDIENVIFAELPTLGIRRRSCLRSVLPRKPISLSSKFGEIPGKQITEIDGSTRDIPEFSSLAEIAERTGKPLRKIQEELKNKSKKQWR